MSKLQDALSRGFMTACSGDGEYQIKIAFETMAEMQAAHTAIIVASTGDVAQASPNSKAEWFCEWLQGYLTPVAGHDELDAFDASTIRNTLNETMGRSPITSTHQNSHDPQGVISDGSQGPDTEMHRRVPRDANASSVPSTVPLPAARPGYRDVVRNWFELRLSEQREIATSLGLPPQGTSSQMDWSTIVLMYAKETGQLASVAQSITDSLARRSPEQTSTLRGGEA